MPTAPCSENCLPVSQEVRKLSGDEEAPDNVTQPQSHGRVSTVANAIGLVLVRQTGDIRARHIPVLREDLKAGETRLHGKNPLLACAARSTHPAS